MTRFIIYNYLKNHLEAIKTDLKDEKLSGKVFLFDTKANKQCVTGTILKKVVCR